MLNFNQFRDTHHIGFFETMCAVLSIAHICIASLNFKP